MDIIAHQDQRFQFAKWIAENTSQIEHLAGLKLRDLRHRLDLLRLHERLAVCSRVENVEADLNATTI